MTFEYTRVSTNDQSPERQHIAIAEYAAANGIVIDRAYEDKACLLYTSFAREDDVHGNKFGVLRKQDETCPTIPAGEDLLLKALRAPTNHEPDQPHVPDIAEETILPVVKKKLRVSDAPIAATVSLIDNEYALAQYVKKLIPMAMIGGHLYLFQPPCFCLLYTSRCV